ncbi:hypothetical protein KBTX_02792 [wastewater metagenome]|uniref:N-acetyltransferase domain-containing protein n=2 Tax=unclassified sequences TaxID=12908 RepID=A0A5B8RG18_9ZZZZ|nr:hypothetical protein [Arhodomonas sp. KWT]QEA06454.1 hypothetical protein KBTEX_02792 [uncultured organism]
MSGTPESSHRFAIAALEKQSRDALWDRIAPFIEQSEYVESAERVRELLDRGALMVWAVLRDDGSVVGSFITRIDKLAHGHALHVLAVGGRDVAAWADDALAAAEQEANDHLCVEVRVSTAPEATAYLSGHGFEPRQVIHVKEL